MRRRDFLVETLLQEGNCLLDQSRHAVQTRDQIFVVFCRLERGRGDHLRDALLHAAHLIDLQELERELIAFDRELCVTPIKVVTDHVGLGKFRPVDRLDEFEIEFVCLLAPRDRLERNIAPPIVLPRITDGRGKLRRFLHGVFPRKIEETMQPIGFAQFFFIREQLFSARREILGWSRPQSRAEQNESAKQEGGVSHEVGDLVASACLVQLIWQ